MAAPSPVVTATIAAGDSLSNAADCAAGRLVGIITPDAWDHADLTFQMSNDGITFYDVFNDQGEECRAVVKPGACVLVPDGWLGWAAFIKLRSGLRDNPAAQTTDRSFTIILQKGPMS